MFVIQKPIHSFHNKTSVALDKYTFYSSFIKLVMKFEIFFNFVDNIYLFIYINLIVEQYLYFNQNFHTITFCFY